MITTLPISALSLDSIPVARALKMIPIHSAANSRYVMVPVMIVVGMVTMVKIILRLPKCGFFFQRYVVPVDRQRARSPVEFSTFRYGYNL